MPLGFLLGGLGTGLAAGMKQGQDLELKREEAKLKTRMLDAQIKHQEAQQRVEDQKQLQLQDLMTGRKNAQAAYSASIGAGQEAQPMVESPGDPALAPTQVEGQPGAGIPGRAMNPQEILTHTAIGDISHPLPAQLFKDATTQRGFSVGPGGAVVDPTGKELYRNPQQRTGVGTESQLFAGVLEQAKAEGITDPGEIQRRWQAVIKANSSARGEGSQAGQLAVKQTPGYIQNQTDVATAKTAGAALPTSIEDALVKVGTLQQNLKDVRENFDPSFLGPVQGSDLAFEARRKLGPISGLGPKETKFRQALADAKNQIVYLMSGKQINEAEGKRLFAALPSATDKDPLVFLSGLDRFEKEMKTIMAAHTTAGSMTRGQLGNVGPAGPTQRKAPAKILSIEPLGP